MTPALTRRQTLVLAALASADGASFAPVQVQKLFFLIDENIAADIGGKQFCFEPYDYGPFDRTVYLELERLQNHGLVSVAVPSSTGPRRYGLTSAGHRLGTEFLNQLPGAASKYISEVSGWVRSLSFAQLVGSIYKAYPDMRANSIFQD